MDVCQYLTTLYQQLGGPLLALDSSTRRASLCAIGWGNSHVVMERTLANELMPSEGMMERLAEMADDTSFDWHTLKAIVVGIGPGGFTGLRVGLAAVKGIAFGADIPLYGVSSLALLAASAGPGTIAVLRDPHKGEIFSALYSVQDDYSVNALCPDASRLPTQIMTEFSSTAKNLGLTITMWAGNGAPFMLKNNTYLAKGTDSDAIINPDLPIRAACAPLLIKKRLLAPHHSGADNTSSLIPNYMRLSEAEKALHLAAKIAPVS